ncbi:hypothetical protein BH11ARM1_BH11ARM1_09830 [soil metagenome]
MCVTLKVMKEVKTEVASDVPDSSKLAEVCWPLAERSPLPMVGVEGGSHLVRYANPAFHRLMGKDDGHLLGLRFEDIVPGDVAQGCSDLIDQILKTGSEAKRNEMVYPMGFVGVPLSNWLCSLWSVPDEQPYGVMIQVTDLTQCEMLLKQSGEVNEALLLSAIREHELRQVLAVMNAALEERVKERTAQLLLSNEQLQGFTYSVAHDLRQQIRGISVNASIVLEDASDILPAETQNNLTRLVHSSKQLGYLVDNLLGYARLTALTPKATPLDMSEIAREVSRYVIDQENVNPRIRFVIAPDLVSVGDHAMVQIVLENLINNACKYSALTESPVVEVGQDDKGFFVRDNGIGFDMQYVNKLFVPFERLHGDDEYAGTGIGLANVKRIVEKHGGKVWADSSPGKGAIFHFTLSA